MSTTLRAALSLAAALIASASAEAETRGAQLAAACSSCHQSAPGSAGIPPIGRTQGGIETAMLAYRSDAGRSQIMHVVAAALTPAEISDVARYLAAQP